MGYKPIYDYTCDLVPFSTMKELANFLNSVFERKLVLMHLKNVGPDATEITIRGTKDQIVPWLRGYYAEHELSSLEDRSVMYWAEDNGKLICIA